jgi:hypothetical protein
MANEIRITAAILSLIRGESTASCVADAYGVTEVQVERWKDIFQVAGVVALIDALKSGVAACELLPEERELGEPTTTSSHRPAKPRPGCGYAGKGSEPTTPPPCR